MTGPSDPSRPATCPAWCVAAHDPARGEEDWLHVSEPLVLVRDVAARLCMSIDPATGERDGPYVLVGEEQLTLEEAGAVGAALIAMVNKAET